MVPPPPPVGLGWAGFGLVSIECDTSKQKQRMKVYVSQLRGAESDTIAAITFALRRWRQELKPKTLESSSSSPTSGVEKTKGKQDLAAEACKNQ